MNAVSASDSADPMPNDGTGKHSGIGRVFILSLFVTGVIKLDPWLDPFKVAIKRRFDEAQKWVKKIDDTEGGLENFTKVNKVRLLIKQTLSTEFRVSRGLASMSGRTKTSCTENGRQMHLEHISSETSVCIFS